MKIFSRLLLTMTFALPAFLYGYATGPDPGYTGAPGDTAKSCIAAGCHSGTPNSGPGSIQMLLPSGNSGTYTPGQVMQIMIKVSDSTKKTYGFEVSARMGSANTTQAGDFNDPDANTQVLCADGSVKNNGASCTKSFPNEYAEQSYAGYLASKSGGGSYTYTLNWTAPAAGSGTVTFYLSGNAGTGADVVTGTDVYSATMTLTEGKASNPNAPSITTGGVVPVYSSATSIQTGSWISIYGQNLATATTIWNGDFPTSLGGTSVTIDGKNAYLWFVSAGQINLQVPDDTATGTVPVVVTTPNGTANSTVTLASAAPSLLLQADGKHVTAIVLSPAGTPGNSGSGWDVIGPQSSTTRPVKAGETLIIYAVGLGPTQSAVPAGKVYSSASATTNPVSFTIGGVAVPQANILFAGEVGAGLYQVNMTVPANLGTGDKAIVASVTGVQSQSGVMLSLQ